MSSPPAKLQRGSCGAAEAAPFQTAFQPYRQECDKGWVTRVIHRTSVTMIPLTTGGSMQVWLPEQQRLDQMKWFLWMRIMVGSMAAVEGAVKASTNSGDIADWVESISLACFLLFWRTRQPGESRWAYLTNVRAILTNLSALAVVISTIWFLAHHIR